MTIDASNPAAETSGATTTPEQLKRLKRRYAAEKRFQAFGIMAICVGVVFLATMFGSIISQAVPAFTEYRIQLNVAVEKSKFPADPAEWTEQRLRTIGWKAMIQKSIRDTLEVQSRDEAIAAHQLLSSSPRMPLPLRDMVIADNSLVGQTVAVGVQVSGNVEAILEGTMSRDVDESRRTVNDMQLALLDKLEERGLITSNFAWTLFTESTAPRSEMAGLAIALVGSFMMMLVVLALSLPIGVSAAIYLEEFAPKNRLTDLIEVNINNLAAVPSIVFGLLGLAVFIKFMGMPQSAPLVGGMVLTLMTLPTVIIATRAALKAVPPSIREAALGVGASKTQAIFHHVLPLAAPGILTSIIIGLAQALGETAPLLMIGLTAAVYDFPGTPLDPASALPALIYDWSTEPERGFVARTSAGIVVLLTFLIFMNALAVYLRKKFERRW